jgi:hypothetical protein
MGTLRFAASNRSPEWETSSRTKNIHNHQRTCENAFLEPYQQLPLHLLYSQYLFTSPKTLLTCLLNEPLHAPAAQQDAAAPAQEVVEEETKPTIDCSVT